MSSNEDDAAAALLLWFASEELVFGKIPKASERIVMAFTVSGPTTRAAMCSLQSKFTSHDKGGLTFAQYFEMHLGLMTPEEKDAYMHRAFPEMYDPVGRLAPQLRDMCRARLPNMDMDIRGQVVRFAMEARDHVLKMNGKVHICCSTCKRLGDEFERVKRLMS